jgi:hypothetical protein
MALAKPMLFAERLKEKQNPLLGGLSNKNPTQQVWDHQTHPIQLALPLPSGLIPSVYSSAAKLDADVVSKAHTMKDWVFYRRIQTRES